MIVSIFAVKREKSPNTLSGAEMRSCINGPVTVHDTIREPLHTPDFFWLFANHSGNELK
jgi:hypothetical protein